MRRTIVSRFPNLVGNVRYNATKVIQKIDDAAIDRGLFVNVQKELECSITQHIMIDPVVTSTGFTFERDAIVRWVNQKGTCPRSKKKMDVINISPSHSIRGMCNDIREKALKALADADCV